MSVCSNLMCLMQLKEDSFNVCFTFFLKCLIYTYRLTTYAFGALVVFHDQLVPSSNRLIGFIFSGFRGKMWMLCAALLALGSVHSVNGDSKAVTTTLTTKWPSTPLLLETRLAWTHNGDSIFNCFMLQFTKNKRCLYILQWVPCWRESGQVLGLCGSQSKYWKWPWW